MVRVEREERAAILEDDAGRARDDARAELVIEALDHRDRVAVGIGGDERDRVAARGRRAECERRVARDPRPLTGKPRGIETCLDRYRAEIRIGQMTIAFREREL